MASTQDKIYDVADQLIANGMKEATAIGANMVLAVVDTGGNLVAFRRMKGSFLVSVNIAQGKAFTAMAMHEQTGNLSKKVLPGEEIYMLEATNPGRIVTFGGGFPLYMDGELIGGFGMSGGTAEEDMACARAAIGSVEGLSFTE